MRNTEPKPIQNVLADTMKEIKSNVNYYAPEAHRETAAGRIREPLDLKTGDIVQVRNGKYFVGRVGQIIGIKYTKFEKFGDGFLYTVRFSDSESRDFMADNLKFVRGADG